MVLKEDKSFLIGVLTFIIVSMIAYVGLKIEWFPTLAIASVISVAIAFIVDKILK